ncbi:nicotinamide riboside kinase 1 [Leguminivora glycinivorella]|uniref:nicotinamide riboside kinase 1 n=1 Tax=Leguminivora glycinivorella TaxID=1035111 RepID=UPI002010326F|nr:nicotinamide riboside kinase 1 [Leguminivora glycinivorella]
MELVNRDQWIVIGISGVTCGGKTTLASNLAHALTPAYLFNQDHYFYPDDSPHHVHVEGMEHNNYDILSSLDMGSMHADVLATMRGEDRAQYSSTERQDRLAKEGKQFLIIEGFTVLNYKPLLDLCDLKYYFVLEYGECFARRALRLYDPPDIPGYFERCVWPEHLKYRAEIERNSSVHVLDGRAPDPMAVVMEELKTKFGVSKS